MLPYIYRRGLLGRRQFATAAACLAKTRRGHGGGGKCHGAGGVPLTSLGERRRPFRPVHRTSETAGQAEKELAAALGQAQEQLRWKEYLDAGDGQYRSGAEEEAAISRRVLEKLIGFSEYSKAGALEKDVWTLLKKQVAIYDNMAGPLEDESAGAAAGETRLELPREIRLAVLQCRATKDYANMLRLYDCFFQLLVKGPLLREAERREELYRLNGCDADADAYGPLVALLDELELSRQTFGDADVDVAVEAYEQTLVRRIEAAWYAVGDNAAGGVAASSLRNLRIYHSGFPALVRLLATDRYACVFGARFVDDFCRDLLRSEMGLEHDELCVMVRNLVGRGRFDAATYAGLRREVAGGPGLAVTPALYGLFLEGAVAGGEPALAAAVAADCAADGYVLDRTLLRALLRMYAAAGDGRRVLRTVDLAVGSGVPLFAPDLRAVVESLVRGGRRSVAVDVVKSLMIVSNGCAEWAAAADAAADADGSERELDDPMLDVGLLFSHYGSDTLLVRPAVDDAVVVPVLATCDTLAEYDALWALVTDDPGFVLTAELVKVDLLLRDRFGVFAGGGVPAAGHAALQRCIHYAMARLPLPQIDRLVLDPDFVEVFVKVCDQLFHTGGLDGDDDALAAAYGALAGVAAEGARSRDALVAELAAHVASGDGAGSDGDGDGTPGQTVARLRQHVRRDWCAGRVQHVLTLSGVQL